MAEVVLNLVESRDARKLDVISIVHQSQYRDTLALIDLGIKKAIDNKKNQDEHIHEAITILGTRGSGKTTFLLSVRDHYEEHSSVQPLDNIDPTLIEEKGHIFLHIISIIDDLVTKQFITNDTDFAVRKKWHDSLYKLSHGLPSMDGVGGSLSEANWQDPEFIMEKGLRSVSAARDLAKSFQELVSEALGHLGKDVFLLTFDDIDIDFRKGWSILETVRKYLHTSKIITILSGDLRLYSLAIRRQYWSSFGKSILINEGDKLNKHSFFNDRITELESQYILKVIKPERRIHLNSIFEKIQSSKVRYNEKSDRYLVTYGHEKYEIEEYYYKILGSLGVKNPYQAEVYVSFLLSLPLRSQIQFLLQFNHLEKEIDRNKLLDGFLSDLNEKNVDVSILDGNPQMVNVEILKLLLREHKLNELYQLQPVTSDISLNSSLVALSFIATIKIRSNPYLIFDYFIKVGYIRNILSIVGYASDTRENYNSLTPSLESLCEYSNIYHNKVLRDIAGNITAYLKGIPSTATNIAGIISLSGLAMTSKKGSEFLSGRIDKVFDNARYVQRVLGYIPLSISGYATINRSIPCYSIYTLIAAIGELVRKAELNDLPRGLAELSEVRTYGIPEFRSGRNDRIEATPFLSDIINPYFPNERTLEIKVAEWIQSFNKLDLIVSPHLLGKISTRFFYAISGIESSEDETNLGEMMHRRVVAFLNAVLIEDVRETFQQIDRFNINNTNLQDDIFISNLQFVGRRSYEVKFSRWLISCPFFLFYLNPETRLFKELKEFLRLEHSDAKFYEEESVYWRLRSVETRANKQNRQIRTTTTSNYDRIIESLKERNIPYSRFEDTNNKLQIRENNSFIRNNLTDIFGENISSATIRAFRNYIKKTGKEW